MPIPRSTLIMGAIALFSSSALLYVLLRPPEKPEEEAPYVLAKPGQTNPIAAKVLAEGGPRTPTISASPLAPRRGVSRIALSFDSDVAPCLSEAILSASKNLGLPETQDPAILAACNGSGSRRLEGMIVLSAAPLGTRGAPQSAPTQATCTGTFRGTLQQNGNTHPVSVSVGPLSGDLEKPCEALLAPLQSKIVDAVKE
jgi:hypothetical protein